MSKAKVDAPQTKAAQVQEPAQEAQEQQQPQEQQPAWLQELLERGTVVISAASREELAEMVNNIPAETRYGAGAVGKNPETGIYSLRLDLIND